MTMHSNKIRIYLMSGRKQWCHDVPKGWKEVAWERFDYVECGIFEKPKSKMTDEDLRLWENYGDIPEGWLDPMSQDKRNDLLATPPAIDTLKPSDAPTPSLINTILNEVNENVIGEDEGIVEDLEERVYTVPARNQLKATQRQALQRIKEKYCE